MENFINMANIQGVLFLYLAVGYGARKLGIIADKAVGSFVDYLLKIALPCMVFGSFRIDFTAETLKTAGLSLAVSFLVCFFSWLVGKVLFLHMPESERSVVQYATLISNAGFAGLPLVQSAFGPTALFYASIFLIPIRVFMWTAGISLFTKADAKTKLKHVLTNPALIAVFLGLAWMLLRLPLHPVLDKAVSSIGDSTSSLSIVVVGAILAEVKLGALLERNVFYYSFIRLVLLPGAVLLAMRLAGFSPELTAPCVVLTGMPAGTTTALLARRYGADYRFASKCVFVSTVLSLITVPLLTLFL